MANFQQEKKVNEEMKMALMKGEPVPMSWVETEMLVNGEITTVLYNPETQSMILLNKYQN